jgi:ubiquinone biosynthesis protein
MTLSLKPHHLKRYKDIAMLFAKYSGPDFANAFESSGALDEQERLPQNGASPHPEELANDLERLGPTFVKLGQLLSSRADLLPEPYLNALSRLQDKVKPFPYEEVEQIVAEELEVRISKGFRFFEEHHMAAASLGQVHRAALRDGSAVVVKVQRPHIRQQIAEDFEVLEEIAVFCEAHTKIGRRYQFAKILNEFKATLTQELDYQREASNLTALADSLKEFPRVVVPRPVPDYCTERVLTMDYVRGTKITALSPLARLDIDGDGLAEELFQAYLKQVLVDGFFHADPHPGNIFLTDDGRVALLDLGMVGRITPGMQEHLLRLLLAISDGDGDEAVGIVLKISQTAESFDETEFRKRAGQLVAEQKDRTLKQHDVGRALLEVTRAAADTGLYAPTDLTLLGKTLLQLDQVGRILSPDFNPNASVRRNVGEIMKKRVLKTGSPARLFGTLLEMKDFVGGLPGRVSRLLDAAANAELEVRVKTPDAHHLLNGFEKIANRITTGVILAALIIGASLLMQVNTRFQIFGYPGLAMVCFLVAASGGICLIISILLKDYRDKQRRRR